MRTSVLRLVVFALMTVLLFGTVQVWAHGGVDDGDDDAPVVAGTPLQVLYPGIYGFQDSVSQAAAGSSPTVPAPVSQTPAAAASTAVPSATPATTGVTPTAVSTTPTAVSVTPTAEASVSATPVAETS